ncbi:MAG: cytochrome c3 family protein [Gammaproteobacteria bacterium]|nr:cytochrome c3 family protein [Gammaproteobacteria bacterium]
MRLITTMIFVLSSFFGSAMAEELTIPPEKSVVEFKTKLRVVTFAHQKHADLKITECKTCHHKIEPADTVVKGCHECHKQQPKDKKIKPKEGEPPFDKTAFHTRCIGCHEYTVAQGMKAGPPKKKCKLCHIKEKKQ